MTTVYPAPVHRSVTQPLLIAGVPRGLALLNGTMAAALGLGGHQLWIFPLNLVIHLVCRALASKDPWFFDVFRGALHARHRLDP